MSQLKACKFCIWKYTGLVCTPSFVKQIYTSVCICYLTTTKQQKSMPLPLPNQDPINPKQTLHLAPLILPQPHQISTIHSGLNPDENFARSQIQTPRKVPALPNRYSNARRNYTSRSKRRTRCTKAVEPKLIMQRAISSSRARKTQREIGKKK